MPKEFIGYRIMGSESLLKAKNPGLSVRLENYGQRYTLGSGLWALTASATFLTCFRYYLMSPQSIIIKK